MSQELPLQLWMKVQQKHIELGLGVGLTCGRCGDDKEFQISNTPLLQFQTDGATVDFRQALAFISRACRNCGHTEFYSLDALGIDWKKKQD